MENHFFTSFSEQELKTIVESSIRKILNEQGGRPNNEEGGFLNFEQACKFLDFAKPTLYSKTSKGEIPHFKKGKRLLFKKSELLKWIEGTRRKTKEDISALAEQYIRQTKTKAR